jgi:hypothetical protein
VQPHQTLTIAVGFADGTFATFDSGYLASPFGWGQLGAGLLAVGAGALGLRARRRELADEPGRPTIIAEYDPHDRRCARERRAARAVVEGDPGEVLEQAVRGSIRILESDGRGWGKPKLIAELVDRSKADGDGMMLLDGLFPGGMPGAQYQFGKQDTRFSKVAQKILAAAETELTARGLRRAVPLRARWLPILLAVAAQDWLWGWGSSRSGLRAARPSVDGDRHQRGDRGRGDRGVLPQAADGARGRDPRSCGDWRSSSGGPRPTAFGCCSRRRVRSASRWT